MRVLEIGMHGVTKHLLTGVVLPAVGTVLVTGKNGSGKSSIIEAVSVGAWETPLRKKPVWSGDKATITLLVEAGKDMLLIQRTRTKSKSTLSFAVSGADPVKYENKTKAQEALEQIIGSHLLWRRTHVFSSADAGHFALATDAERKRMLEDLLGLDRFDAAAARIGADARLAEKVYREAERELASRSSAREVAVQRAQDAFEALAEAEDTHVSLVDVEDEIEEVGLALERHAQQVEGLRKQERALDLEISNAEAHTERERDTARRAADAGSECPTCAQAIPHEHVERLRKAARFAEVASDARLVAKRAELTVTRESLRAATSEVLQLRDRRATLKEQARAAQEAAQRLARLQEVQRRAQQALQGAIKGQEEARVAAEALRGSWVNLDAAARVLALGGVRAHLLGQALGGIEGVANAWLDRMTGGGLELTLQPYAEKISGGVKDAISLEVTGAGGGHGYWGASGGERRRIDVALMLALAEIAEAAAGTARGTIFFDEVFDALDDEGVDAACRVIDELAQDRCVVVISHNPELQSRLKVTRHLTVSNGAIT